jgi:hypothetical protein
MCEGKSRLRRITANYRSSANLDFLSFAPLRSHARLQQSLVGCLSRPSITFYRADMQFRLLHGVCESVIWLGSGNILFFFLRCCCCRLVQVDEDKLQRKAGKKKTRNRRDFHVIQQSRFAFSTEIEYQIDTE